MKFELHKYLLLPAFSLLILLAACTQQQQSPQEIQERTARATEEAKRDVKAVAEGIREGWSRDKPLDLNSATKADLISLPGVTAEDANRVIAGRPYGEPNDLLTRHILPRSTYEKISERVTVRK